MQDDINNIAGQRDSELADLETRLHEVQDRMYEMERADMSTAEREEDDRRDRRGGSRGDDDRRGGGGRDRDRDDRRGGRR